MAGTKAKRKVETESATVIETVKGFDKNLSCRGFQFEIGKTYSVAGNIKACESGFHACENPFDVWGYYPLSDDEGNLNRFCAVEQSGEIDFKSDDTKIASASITIKAELSLPQFISRGVDYILNQVNWKDAKESNTGNQSAATNTGYQSAATNTGNQSAATNTGDQSAATNTGYRSAATNTGKEGVALASGCRGRVSGADGCALFLVERDDNFKIIAAWAGIVGKDNIKADTFYTLRGGKPVEA